MPANVAITDQWQDIVAAVNLVDGDQRTLIARDNAIEVYVDPAGGVVPAGARGDVIYPGSTRRAADRPLLEVTASLKLWARGLRSHQPAVLVLTET